MDIIDTFTKKQQDDNLSNNILEQIKNENNAGIIEGLEKLLGPLNFDQEILNHVIISSLPKTEVEGPQGPILPPIHDNYIVHDPSNYVMVTGPDGEQYYTDNHGLFINVKDAKLKAGYDNKPQMSAEDVVEVIIGDANSAKEVGVSVCWNEDNSKILATVNVPEGISVQNVNKKSIFEHFTLLEVDSFSLSEVCEITYSINDIPTCLFYTAKAVEQNLSPSPYYKFDRPSKFHGSCSNELVVKESADSNPSCVFDMNPKATFACKNFVQSPWEDAYLTSDNEGKDIVLQSRRYGIGELKWRAIEKDSNEVVATSSDQQGFEDFVKSISEFLGELTEVVANKQEPLTQDKVYTHHVANI